MKGKYHYPHWSSVICWYWVWYIAKGSVTRQYFQDQIWKMCSSSWCFCIFLFQNTTLVIPLFFKRDKCLNWCWVSVLVYVKSFKKNKGKPTTSGIPSSFYRKSFESLKKKHNLKFLNELFFPDAIHDVIIIWRRKKEVPFQNPLCNANTFRRECYLSMDFSKFSLGSQCDLLTYIELKAHW